MSVCMCVFSNFLSTELPWWHWCRHKSIINADDFIIQFLVQSRSRRAQKLIILRRLGAVEFWDYSWNEWLESNLRELMCDEIEQLILRLKKLFRVWKLKKLSQHLFSFNLDLTTIKRKQTQTNSRKIHFPKLIKAFFPDFWLNKFCELKSFKSLIIFFVLQAKDQYANEVQKLARPLPVEYLLVDLPTSSPLVPLFTFPAKDRQFPVENRLIDGHLQDFGVLHNYMEGFTSQDFLMVRQTVFFGGQATTEAYQSFLGYKLQKDFHNLEASKSF